MKPGSISVLFPNPKAFEVEKSSSLGAAIAGARSAAIQFANKDNNLQAITQINAHDSLGTDQTPSRCLKEDKLLGYVESVVGLWSQDLAPEIPEDLYHLIKKAVSIRKHLKRNRKDKDSKFQLILVESRIHRLARKDR
ncbi:40S ribosomal protein S13 [Quillaja saponaria]|uniref:40S ribosomal protein S13 n=1 Tax=Quillaja saponaria TaxID=32244 RepID=A0AAD7L2F1_QUISA|nr:40S ribosomal protein S13 [Quillaja saponaria]